MSKCDVTRDALIDSEENICPACNKSRSCHHSESYLLRLREIENNKEVRLREIENNKEIRILEIETNKEIEFKKIDQKYSESNKSRNTDTHFIDYYNQCDVSIEILELSRFGNDSVNIIKDDITNESSICNQFSKIFNEGLGFSFYRYIFSSENNVWLYDKNSRKKYKPDLFLCTVPFAEPKVCKLINLKSAKPAIPRFIGFVKFVFEGKNESLTNSHIGKLIFYLRLLNNYQSISYGLLFNSSDFYFLKLCPNDKRIKLKKGTWNSPGSYQYILEKILKAEIPNAELYDNALKYIGTTFKLDINKPFDFLGSGKFGKVFSCILDGNFCSVKLVKIGDDGDEEMTFSDVEQELESFKAIYELSSNLTLKPHLQVLRYESEIYGSIGAYLLHGVGNSVSSKHIKQVFSRLYDLHYIKFIHGDPRLPNIVDLNGSLRWIDFRYDLPFTKDNIANDVKILTRSFFGDEEISSKTDIISNYADALYFGDKDGIGIDILLLLIDKKKKNK